jgi:hypothetical protein
MWYVWERNDARKIMKLKGLLEDVSVDGRIILKGTLQG